MLDWLLGLEEIRKMLRSIITKQEKIMARMDDLIAKLEENEDHEDAVLVMLQDIAQQLRDAQGDPAKVEQAIAMIERSSEKLAAAVVQEPEA